MRSSSFTIWKRLFLAAFGSSGAFFRSTLRGSMRNLLSTMGLHMWTRHLPRRADEVRERCETGPVGLDRSAASAPPRIRVAKAATKKLDAAGQNIGRGLALP